MKYKLIEGDSGAEVKPGMNLVLRGEMYKLISFHAPRHAASTGRVIVMNCDTKAQHEYFPSVFNLAIVEAQNDPFDN